MELGRPKEAVGPLRQVVQADKDNANARQALAEALLTLEQFAEASTQLEALAVSAAAVAAGVGCARPQLRRRGPRGVREAAGTRRRLAVRLAAGRRRDDRRGEVPAGVFADSQGAGRPADAARRASHARACVRRERPRRLGRRRAEARRGGAAVLRHGARGVCLPDRQAGGRDRAHGVGVTTGGAVLAGARCQRSRRPVLRDAGEAAAVGGAVRRTCGNRPRPEPAARGRDAVA